MIKNENKSIAIETLEDESSTSFMVKFFCRLTGIPTAEMMDFESKEWPKAVEPVSFQIPRRLRSENAPKYYIVKREDGAPMTDADYEAVQNEFAGTKNRVVR